MTLPETRCNHELTSSEKLKLHGQASNQGRVNQRFDLLKIILTIFTELTLSGKMCTWRFGRKSGPFLLTQISWHQEGKHTLRIYLIDPGVVPDRITIDLGGLKQTYDATIPETKYAPVQKEKRNSRSKVW